MKQRCPRGTAVRDRFMEFIDMVPIAGCWLWNGHLYGGGYGIFWINKKQRSAEKAVREILRIGDGLDVAVFAERHGVTRPAIENILAGALMAPHRQERTLKRITDKDFKYTNAADTSKPGYLAAKFAAIRRELDAAMVSQPKPAVVSPIKRGR